MTRGEQFARTASKAPGAGLASCRRSNGVGKRVRCFFGSGHCGPKRTGERLIEISNNERSAESRLGLFQKKDFLAICTVNYIQVIADRPASRVLRALLALPDRSQSAFAPGGRLLNSLQCICARSSPLPMAVLTSGADTIGQ
jgi:hypothetical protein